MCTCVYGRGGGEQSQRPSPVLHHRVRSAQISRFCSHFPAKISTIPHAQGYAILWGGYPQEVGPEEEATCALKTGWDI